MFISHFNFTEAPCTLLFHLPLYSILFPLTFLPHFGFLFIYLFFFLVLETGSCYAV